jgi:hypothetical protein
MKLTTLLTISTISFALLTASADSFAKEQSGHHKSESRKVVVNGNSKSSSAKQHGSSHKSSSHKSHSSHKKYHNGHKKYHGGHKKHYSSHKKHRRHYKKRHYNIGLGLHYTYGPHGRYYNGHAWCPSHFLYHTHGFSIYSNHHSHYNYSKPRKVETFIELDDGMCYKVTEYSNGDQKRKRIRDYHCDEIDDWDDWEE